MKKTINYFIFILSGLLLFSCSENKDENSDIVQIVPRPTDVVIKNGYFEWNRDAKIVITTDDPELKKMGQSLADIITLSLHMEVTIEKGDIGSVDAIILHLDNSVEGEEAYHLDVDKHRVLISASRPSGIFYGIQSLLQLLPPQILEEGGLEVQRFHVNAMNIADSPRFPYRGMHLDVSRNFVSKEDVKKFIDLLAMYKFNRFHWHLTDGAGWRIEIKKYPLLTQKTAFRAQSTWKEFWNEGGRKFVDEGTPNSYGGYYTQEDIKEIVAYAKDRYITVIPEIEMPGHSEEVFVGYPQLSCSGKAYVDSDFCAGNEETFTFLEDVLTEVMELFPSEYIHIGGDEAGKSAWKTCPKCQKRIKDESLQNVDELQSYFIKRISNFLTSKGRKLIGWDEIIDGGLASDATVMLWRDPQSAIHAAELGHNVIMTPGTYCYFDAYQADPTTEPEAIGGYLPLRKVYLFEVVAKDSLASYFIGGQGNIWTEYINDFKHVEYMSFPRAIALSEALWSAKERRSWVDFKKRLQNQLPRLDYLDVNYHRPSYELEILENVDTIHKKIEVRFESEQFKPMIRYTTDGSEPTQKSTLYNDNLAIDKPVTLKAAIFVDGKPQKIFTKNIGYHLGIGKKVTYAKQWTSYPAGGETALIDGLFGGLSYSDNLWQGFTSDMDVTIDLEKVTRVNTFNANFMQLIGPGVYMPEYVEVLVSVDGVAFESVLKVENDVPKDYDRLRFKDFGGSLQNKDIRYVKVFAKNSGGFIFVDELVIN